MLSQFTAYLRERFRPQVFGVAVLGLTLLAIATAAGGWDVGPAARALLMMGLLVLQFRLWDDLEDRGRDAQTHPERVLVRAAPRPFWWALIALAWINLGMVKQMGTQPALASLVGLDLAALVAYWWLRTIVSGRVWTHWILLAKYPVLVAIVALATGPVTWQLLLVACGLSFGAAHVYERAHNRAPGPGDHR